MAAAGNPLAGLQEIPLPDPISYAPATAGWIVVGALLLALLVYLAWRAAKRWRANAYRRAALAELATIEKTTSLGALPALLKRTAIAATSRDEVAGLSGQEWLRFLDRTLGGESFTRGHGQLLTRIAYRTQLQFDDIPRDDVAQLLQLSRRWIKHHDAHI
jgi:hypothetical protein